MSEATWFEVWVDDTATPPYILLLFSDDKEENLQIFDPAKSLFLHSAKSYKEAMYWLTEDEYTKVDGRMLLE